MSFKNKVVLVTGASSGIGASIAIQFAKEDAFVAIVGRNVAKLQKVATLIETDSGKKPLVITADVAIEDDARRIIKSTTDFYGKLDVLINNAGINSVVDITDEAALKTFDRVLNTNLRSVIHLTHLAVPHLVSSKGNIINISSIASLMVIGTKNWAYETSKAALDHFSRSMARTLASEGVRVNIVNPGPVKTDIILNMGVNPDYANAIMENMGKSTALKRVSDPEEIADLVVFLASEKAKGITGSSFVTDNGNLLTGSAV